MMTMMVTMATDIEPGAFCCVYCVKAVRDQRAATLHEEHSDDQLQSAYGYE